MGTDTGRTSLRAQSGSQDSSKNLGGCDASNSSVDGGRDRIAGVFRLLA